MKRLTVAVDIEYDHNTVSPSEVIYDVKKAIDTYFNGFYSDYEEEVLRIIEVHENTPVVSPWDKG